MLVRFTSSLMALVISGLVGFWPAGVRAQDEQALLAGFHPYRDGKPQVEGLTPGLQITKDNAQLVEGVLPPELFRVVAAGDFPLTIQETTDFPPTQSYIDASLTYAGQTQIGADGELTNYTAGQPFPHIDPSDPQAGLKVAWNFRYRHFGDTMQNHGTLRSVNSSGNIERAVENAYARMYGMHRPNPDNNVAQWEKEGTWFRDHSIVLSPQDLEGAQQLTFHYAADADAKKAWAYDPRSRRTRSVVVNMLDSSFGLNFMVEDYSGFNGYLSEHDWEYVGEQVALVPGLLQKTPPEFGGKNGWYPLIPWELRRVVILDATPKKSGHPYGKRRLYIDRQFYSALYAFAYDHDGVHQRTLFHTFANPAFDPDNAGVQGVPLHVGNAWVDYLGDMASIWTGTVTMNKPINPKRFTVKEMVRRGK